MPGAAAAQLAPPTSGGHPRFDWLLQRAAEGRRLLLIAAHPDDEDTGLLVTLARGRGADAAYLSLSRGEGGQNLLGTELGSALGLLRTEELRAARSVDGAAQFFTRAYDFGYSRSLDETARFWLPDTVLKDAVRIVRRFRPHVIVAVFSGTPRDGHGQHQMAGVIARRAFDAAGDTTRFTELAAEEGLAPWRPLKLYTSARFNAAAATLRLPEGTLEPRSGRTLHQLAMESRSRHRSQDFGVLQRLGSFETRLALEHSLVPGEDDPDVFAGIPPAETWATRFADSLRRTVTPATLAAAVPPLARAVTRLREEGGDPRTLALLGEALAIAAGVVIDARLDQPALIPGDSAAVDIEVYHAGTGAVRWRGAWLRAHNGSWRDSLPLTVDTAVTPGTLATRRRTVRVPRGTEPTQPYFLARPPSGGLYDWLAAPVEDRGTLMQPPVLTASVVVEIDRAAVTLSREVTDRVQDQAVGEVRRPVRVVPRVEVRLDPDTLLWPAADTAPRRFTVALMLHGADPVEGEVRVEADGWRAPAAQPFRLTRSGENVALAFEVRRPPDLMRADVRVRATAVTTTGERFRLGSEEIAYPHVRPAASVRPAESLVRVAPVTAPRARRIGYVRGASDRVPEALLEAGLLVTVLDGESLARGDLAGYEAIVIGSRAYETDSALVRHNARLLEYVRRGGRLVVQYQQYAFVTGRYAPFPLEIARPHDRVTDETAPVAVLDPGHPVFQRPNVIGPTDWEGWPQERGLYFPRTWDEAYVPLLEMHDAGQPPQRGALLVAPMGRGTYVYTGLSFFRALPAGVPGAFRLFFNLLEPVRATIP